MNKREKISKMLMTLIICFFIFSIIYLGTLRLVDVKLAEQFAEGLKNEREIINTNFLGLKMQTMEVEYKNEEKKMDIILTAHRAYYIVSAVIAGLLSAAVIFLVHFVSGALCKQEI
ncbi:hypothetical protein PRVXT_001230 [Proteinivorax tanatarense]|uniref:Uncharacterized protein n=1 Tax=Proteinivorax tanatarense TaxID=1260629 RepID=A0AAU7VPJ6_9FIRM